MDVVISNCVINLCPDKRPVLAEASRVLRAGGRFAVADIVALREVSEDTAARMRRFLGCGSVILTVEGYRAMLAYDSNLPEGNPITPGVITIKNAAILTPNVHVVDAAREINDVIYVIGQTLGTGSGPIVVDRDVFVKDPALAKDVQISKNPSPTPTPTPIPAVTTTAAAANIPQTGDELPLTLITVCIIAAGVAMWLTHRRIA